MLQVSGEAFDHAPAHVDSKLFLCSTGRTGSNLLCRALTHNNIGVPHEYLNYVHAGIIGKRFGFSVEDQVFLDDANLRHSYLKRVMDCRTVNGIFAIKLSWWQYERFLDNPDGDIFFDGGQFVYIYREDLFGQAISRRVATLTGVWGPDETVTTEPRLNPDFLNREEIMNSVNTIARHDANWRAFFAKNDIAPLFVSYEQITKDLPGVLPGIARKIGLEVTSTGLIYEEERMPRGRDPATPSVAEIRADFLSGYQRVRTAR